MAQPQPLYDIRISDAQRHYLLVALNQCRMQGYYGADADGCEAIDMLHGMLDQGLVAVAKPFGRWDDNVLNDFTE